MRASRTDLGSGASQWAADPEREDQILRVQNPHDLTYLIVAERLLEQRQHDGALRDEVSEAFHGRGLVGAAARPGIAVLQEGDFVEEGGYGFGAALAGEIPHLFQDAGEEVLGGVAHSHRGRLQLLVLFHFHVLAGFPYGFRAGYSQFGNFHHLITTFFNRTNQIRASFSP